LIGRLTRDPEGKFTPQGIAVAQLGIAVNRFSKNDQGEYEVDFFNIVAWRKTAEFATNYLKKGRLVSIDGRLQSRSWVDQATGQKRTVYEIVADDIQGLDKKPDDAGQEAAATDTETPVSGTRPNPAPARRAQAPAPSDDIDESDPFADD